jgi:hypothetical protein
MPRDLDERVALENSLDVLLVCRFVDLDVRRIGDGRRLGCRLGGEVGDDLLDGDLLVRGEDVRGGRRVWARRMRMS